MATSPDFRRLAGGVTRSLSESAFESLRDAVVIVDARAKNLPVVLANATARRCLFGNCSLGALDACSLYEFLGTSTDPVIATALELPRGGIQGVSQLLGWVGSEGNFSIVTELKMLMSSVNPRLVMLTFAEPSPESSAFAARGECKSLLKRESLQCMAEVGAWEYCVATQEMMWTDEMFRIFETSPKDFAVAWEPMFGRCTPESRLRFDDEYAAAELSDDGFDLDIEITSLKGQRLWLRIVGYVEKRQGRPFRTFGSVRNIQTPHAHEGTYRRYGAVARPLFDTAGQPRRLVGVSQDVTDRHECQLRLRRSEELLRATTAHTADTLLLLDEDLRIRFINRAEIGMSIDQIIGRHVSVLLPEMACAGVLAKLRHVLATAATATYEFDVRAAGAPTQFLENRAVLVRDHDMGICICVTVRNVTERKRLEQEVLDVSNRERQTIGRDLHDGLGQELTGVALMLRALATRIHPQSPESSDKVGEIVGLVNQSIESARALARGLLPVDQHNGGLPFALRTLADRSCVQYGFTVDCHADVSPHAALSETSASHLYRIVQEALTNAARHGRASAASILLLVTRGKVLLEIADDGVGIGNAAHSANGLGLKIMKYRAGMIGASLEIMANQPQGTIVRVTCEQPISMGELHCAHAI